MRAFLGASVLAPHLPQLSRDPARAFTRLHYPMASPPVQSPAGRSTPEYNDLILQGPMPASQMSAGSDAYIVTSSLLPVIPFNTFHIFTACRHLTSVNHYLADLCASSIFRYPYQLSSPRLTLHNGHSR